MQKSARPLRATYRLQVHKEFTLDDARAIVPYLARLGISHLYTSPILKARPGSTHGYDVADPTAVNPEIGGEGAFRALADALHEHEMGYVLDIVPNHMGTGESNPYWEDVLARGRDSRYASWFDIDWDAPDPALRGRVLVPVLADELDAVLERGELSIGRGAHHDTPRLSYFDKSFPLSAETVADLRGESIAGKGAEPRRRLRAIIDRQHYSLASWRRAATEINYRRFFDVNELVALRMEDPAVFEATHARILEWVGDGSLDGLRIDHVDGLFDPQGYLDRLRAEVTKRRGDGFPIFVEKILSPGERLRSGWPVQGTTGYEVLNDLESVLIDAEGFETIEAGYRKLVRSTGLPGSFEEVAMEGKLNVLRGALSPDVARLTRLLASIAATSARLVSSAGRPARDTAGAIDTAALEEAIVELIACLPVYRTYIDGADGVVPAADMAVLDRALARARARGNASSEALDLLADVLSAESAPEDAGDRAARHRFVRQFQQASGPATAKGVEDTALYLYMPLVSRDEVGGSPDRPLGESLTVLHESNALRAEHWPQNLICTNTHDTKRSTGVRSRLDVLSEMPDEWMRRVRRWRTQNRTHRRSAKRRPAPDANTEYLFYQALLGIWPLGLVAGKPVEPDVLEQLRERLEAYMLKAAKEGKARTTWTDPNEAFEDALEAFVRGVLFESPDFIADFAEFAAHVARPALWNTLSRTLLHLTVPGVPDIYQGDELWSFALVDPDNRRAVDYAHRQALLAELEAAEAEHTGHVASLLRTPEDGRVKMHVVRELLRARREHESLFARGRYVPLRATGEEGDSVVAFARLDDTSAALAVAPRLVAGLVGDRSAPTGATIWGESRLEVPPELSDRRWRCALTGRILSASSARRGLALGEILASLPVALLMAEPR
jgi:(1->4)-alpha-D-glucan 1-alpha-D-glucosylmutase